MKKIYISLFLLSTLVAGAQTKPADVKYRRSSLHTIIIDDAGLIKADIIKDAFMKAPIPEKFNDHTLKQRSFDSRKYPLTDAEKGKISTEGDSKGKALLRGVGSSLAAAAKGQAAAATGGLIDTTNTKYLPQIINKYLVSNNVARDMVAKWFNRSEKGGFNMTLIGDRGSYNASEMEVNIAKKSARGLASISDAGVELIGNTFVVVTRFNYISKKALYDAASNPNSASLVKINIQTSPELEAAKQAAIKKATEGYVVQTTSYLYQLIWNDSIEAVFYQDLWMDDANIDPKKKEAFDKTNLFQLKYIGDEKAMANVPMSLKQKRSDDELVAVATVNAVDAVIAKLEKSYEVFRTKTPLLSGDPATAKIGMKEGLEGGDKFEVLEQTLDPKTGKTTYVRVGKIKVDDSQIWDNRYMADVLQESETATDPSTPAKPKVDRTLFKGGSSKFYSGMLIRQMN
ncbi:MAG: hypothetical protein WCP52_08285 [Bacteroidota bacterium]